ncbi:MAG TPA: efflux RND transporter periplasmic adaptor subunit [Cyclobacteriaceae bacterium]|nr:efflux RND transporter periplasmic adaptor subunit [Cyclobacteriaceae bacterium]
MILTGCEESKKDGTAAAGGGQQQRAGGGAGGQGGGGGNRQRGPMVVDGFLVEQHQVSETVEVPGSLFPAEETAIRAEVSGRVVRLNIPEGGMVKKGDVLVKLFDDDLQAQLRKLTVQLQIAEKTAERQKELLAINGISQQDYDLASLSVDNLKADIEAVKISIAKTEIRAPYEGQVGLRNVSLGSYLGPTDIVTTVRDVNQLKLEFFVPEKYAKTISKGYVVRFRVDGGRKDHSGTVMATEGNVNAQTRTLRIRAIVTGRDNELVPGVFAKVNLQLGQTDQALMIPTQAVIPTARNKQVIVLRKDSAIFNIVETGIRDSAYVQINSGLKKGDTVIVTGLMAIRPAAKLKIGKLNKLPRS